MKEEGAGTGEIKEIWKSHAKFILCVFLTVFLSD